MLLPKKVKYRKMQKGKVRGLATRGSMLAFGEYGLKALDNGLLRSNHIEAARVLIARKMKGSGKLWINVFPAKPVTKKPAETRQGKGKGDLDHWVCPIHRGRILFEMGGVPEEFAKTIFRLVAFKMPVRTKFITRSGAA
ncbi:MAG TPA: 50S ribosomal protein L16 [Candidatus Omnitrophota bacterium]|nr:50S ribosomal protein L16 [Candidatus Omnitrophota bacterium]